MSWSRVALVGLLFVAACGFHPLYGGGEGAGAVRAELAAIRIRPIADRTGQQLYNELRDRLNPGGQPTAPRYVLAVELQGASEFLGLRGDQTPTRTNLTLSASYTLTDAATDKVVTRGQSRSTISYDILRTEFATIASGSDARARGVSDLADDIRTRLAVFLSQPVADSP
jgi:LPS-assembly lipoprotein